MAAVAMNVTLKKAIELMGASYATLSRNAQDLGEIGKKTGKPIPIEMVKTYNRAVSDYLKLGREVFDALEKHGGHIEQVLYRGGKTIPDPKNPGRLLTAKWDAPLRPPVFVGGGLVYPSANTSSAGVISSIRTPPSTEVGIAWGTWGLITITGIGLVAGAPFILLVGGIALAVLNEIRVMIHGDFDAQKQVEAYVKAASVLPVLTAKFKEQGYSDEKAAELALKALEHAKKETEEPSTGIGTIVLGAAAILGGAYVVATYSKKAA